MLARQTTLQLWFCVFHLRECTLELRIVFNTASFGTALPRTVAPHVSIFHESDDVCIFVIK